MTTYSPKEIALWALADWNKLAGKLIVLGTENIWETRTVGTVRFGDSPYGPDRMVIVEWADCGSLSFVRELGATVTVDE